jgi:hypothetical protein
MTERNEVFADKPSGTPKKSSFLTGASILHNFIYLFILSYCFKQMCCVTYLKPEHYLPFSNLHT